MCVTFMYLKEKCPQSPTEHVTELTGYPAGTTRRQRIPIFEGDVSCPFWMVDKQKKTTLRKFLQEKERFARK